MTLKKHDFVEMEYTATDQQTSKIFDLTSEKEAKKHNIYNSKAKYGPITICIGENQIIQGLDKSLIGKEINKPYTIDITPEEGFGKKDPKLMKLLPLKIFKKQNIQPFPGLQINLDNLRGTVRSVSGGRVIMDFNHPLSGHNLTYKIKVTKIITDTKIKTESILKYLIPEPKIEIKDQILTVLSEIPQQLQPNLNETILRLIPSIKEVKFKIPSQK